MKHTSFLAYGAILVGVFSIGFSAIFVRWAQVPGVVAAFYRLAFGLTVMAPFFFYQQRRRAARPASPPHRGAPRRTMLIALLAGLFFAGDLGTWSTSVLFSSAANTTLLANTAPVYVGLGALLFFGERPAMLFWIGLLVALTGMALIIGEDLRGAAGLGLGDMLALLAGVFYGAYLLTISRARRGMDTLTASWTANVSSVIALLVLSLAFGHALWGFSKNQWLALIAAGVVSQAVGYGAITYALGKLPAPIVSASLLGQPVVTAILSIPLLGEDLSPIQIAGGLATLAGIYLVNRSRVSRPRPTQADPAAVPTRQPL